MHTVRKVPAHEAIAAAPKYLESRAACHDDADAPAVGVEEAFEEGSPLRVLVQLVEDDDRRRRANPVELQTLADGGRTANDDCAIVCVVPVQIVGGL